MRPLTWVLLSLLLVIVLGASIPYFFEQVERQYVEGSTIGFAAIVLLIGMLMIRRLNRRLQSLAEVAEHIGRGNYLVRSPDEGRDAVGELSRSVNAMVDKIQSSVEALEEKQKELESNRLQLEEQNLQLSGEQSRQEAFGQFLSDLNSVDLGQIAYCGLSFATEQTGAVLGQFYLSDEEGIKLLGELGVDRQALADLQLGSGEGLPAEVLRRGQWIVLEGLSGASLPRVNLGISRVDIMVLVAAPVVFQGRSLGVLLLAYTDDFSQRQRMQVQSVLDALGGSLNNAMTYKMVQRQALKLEQANQELLEADRLRSEFVANMSHELRTPLNSVIGFSSVLMKNRNQSLLEKDLNFVEKIHRNGKHLLSLINDILDLSKIEAGRMEVELRPVLVQDVVRDTSEMLQTQAEAKNVALRVEGQLDLPYIQTDGDKLRQVLINLVGNALKFTERGSVTLKVGVESQWLRIDVIDTGIGIAEDKLMTVFEPFRQADAGTTRQYGGTGLGLAITRSIVEMLDGRVELDSVQGQGSTFSVYLPMNSMAEKPPKPKHSEPTAEKVEHSARALQSGLEQRRVLVIDDDSDARELTANYLREGGVTVETADSGETGLTKARQMRPDAITLDIMMPGLSGWEVLRALKADPELASIPVVIVSIVAEKRKALVLGAVDALEKPLVPEALMSVMERCLAQSQASRLMVVDDSHDVWDLFESALSSRVQTIRFAEHGKAALALLEEYVPDLIFLDLMMPEMDGLTFLRHLRSDARFEHIPVVVVTAKPLSMEERRELEMRVVDIVEKGEQMIESRLLKTLEEALESK